MNNPLSLRFWLQLDGNLRHTSMERPPHILMHICNCAEHIMTKAECAAQKQPNANCRSQQQ
jgi:hypothetical protein